MNFSLIWRKWILECFTTSMLVNESPKDEFRLRRGLHQGDHLSPF